MLVLWIMEIKSIYKDIILGYHGWEYWIRFMMNKMILKNIIIYYTYQSKVRICKNLWIIKLLRKLNFKYKSCIIIHQVQAS